MERKWLERWRDAARASPSEVVLLLLVGIAVVGGSALVFVRKSEPPPPPIQRLRSSEDAGHVNPSQAESAPAKTVLVHVAGLVAAPGVYELPGGSRVKDAIAAAGGPKDGGDIDALNLAASLSDGQKITVGKPGEPVEMAAAPMGGPGSGVWGESVPASAKVNLNTATAAQLDTLPSIGPVLAERILAFRQQAGGFRSISQLKDVTGIGSKKYEGIKDLVTV